MSTTAVKERPIDFSRFLDKEDDGENLSSKPFVINGWKYACHGRIRIMRVPSDEPNTVPPDGLKLLPCTKIFEEVFDNDSGDWLAFPDPSTGKKDFADCRKCDGTGCEKHVICDQCDGSGDFECDKCGHMENCSHCDGEGFIGSGECDECKGETEVLQFVKIMCGGKLIRWDNYEAMASLPGAVFQEYGAGIMVKFDGGQAIAADMNPD